MNKKFKVEFMISGTMLSNDTKHTKELLKQNILGIFNSDDAQNYHGNREIDTSVTDLKIKDISRQIELSRQDIELLKHGDSNDIDYVADIILEQLGELDI